MVFLLVCLILLPLTVKSVTTMTMLMAMMANNGWTSSPSVVAFVSVTPFLHSHRLQKAEKIPGLSISTKIVFDEKEQHINSTSSRSHRSSPLPPMMVTNTCEDEEEEVYRYMYRRKLDKRHNGNGINRRRSRRSGSNVNFLNNSKINEEQNRQGQNHRPKIPVLKKKQRQKNQLRKQKTPTIKKTEYVTSSMEAAGDVLREFLNASSKLDPSKAAYALKRSADIISIGAKEKRDSVEQTMNNKVRIIAIERETRRLLGKIFSALHELSVTDRLTTRQLSNCVWAAGRWHTSITPSPFSGHVFEDKIRREKQNTRKKITWDLTNDISSVIDWNGNTSRGVNGDDNGNVHDGDECCNSLALVELVKRLDCAINDSLLSPKRQKGNLTGQKLKHKKEKEAATVAEISMACWACATIRPKFNSHGLDISSSEYGTPTATTMEISMEKNEEVEKAKIKKGRDGSRNIISSDGKDNNDKRNIQNNRKDVNIYQNKSANKLAIEDDELILFGGSNSTLGDLSALFGDDDDNIYKTKTKSSPSLSVSSRSLSSSVPSLQLLDHTIFNFFETVACVMAPTTNTIAPGDNIYDYDDDVSKNDNCTINATRSITNTISCTNSKMVLSRSGWRELSTLAWSYAVSGHGTETSTSFLTALAEEATKRLKDINNDCDKNDFLPRDVAQIAWALSRVESDNHCISDSFATYIDALSHRLFDTVLQVEERKESSRPSHLNSLLYVEDNKKPMRKWKGVDLVQLVVAMAHGRIDDRKILCCVYDKALGLLKEELKVQRVQKEGGKKRRSLSNSEIVALLWSQARLHLTSELSKGGTLFGDFLTTAPLILLRRMNIHNVKNKDAPAMTLGPQELANIAWSLTVLGGHYDENRHTIALLRYVYDETSKMCSLGHAIRLEHAHQLWQSLFVLGKECPDAVSSVLGGGDTNITAFDKGTNSSFVCFLEREWEREKERRKTSSSRHRALSFTLKGMGVRHSNEHEEDIDVAIVLRENSRWTSSAEDNSLDSRVERRKVAVE